MSAVSVSIAVINCNRLFYAASQIKSLIDTLGEDANCAELLIIDNASSEPGTCEFLDAVEHGSLTHEFASVSVIRRPKRDPSNEFAAALNIAAELAKGEILIPLQGDAQFVRRGWLSDVREACSRSDCGCVVIDAQRASTLLSADPIRVTDDLFIDFTRPPFSGAADVAYPIAMIRRFYPWNTANESHEGGSDSETEMLRRVRSNCADIACYVLASPAMLTIQTDPRGTNARVRGTKRYGVYFAAPLGDNLYYEISDDVRNTSDSLPLSAEKVLLQHPARGWSVALGPRGEWLKNPIRPETAVDSDWVEIS